MLKIDKNVPIPTLHRIYPFSTMEIGDSFLVRNISSEAKSTAGYRVRWAIARYKKQTSKSFTTRKTDIGIRVWRVS